MDFGSVILWVLWRFFPVLWLDRIVARLIAWAVELVENEEKFAWLCERPANAQWFGGWLRFAETRLDELIAIRALQLLGRRLRAVDVPAHYPATSVRTPAEALARLHRLCGRYFEAERLARLRAFKLRRLYAALDPLGRTDHRPAPAAVVASSAQLLAAPAVAAAVVATPAAGPRIRAPPKPGNSLEDIGVSLEEESFPPKPPTNLRNPASPLAALPIGLH
jgi:hypothetical protein